MQKMSFKRYLISNRSSFLFVDPGINFLGYCIYNCWVHKNDVVFEITKYGVHMPTIGPESTVQARIRSIYQPIRQMAKEQRVKRMYVEEPPSTVYGDRETTSVHKVIARAQSVFKTVSVCHSLIASFDMSIPIETIWPSQWEPSKKERRGQDIKEWSLEAANVILEHKANIDAIQETGMLRTKVDSNAADAINIGYRVVMDLISGKRDLV